jgi:hypothetical protein
MAAVTRVKAEYITPVGYEVNDTGKYTEDVIAGDELVINGEVSGVKTWGKCPTTETEGQGIAIKNGKTGGVAEVLIQGELSGFSGLTAGAPIYPSATVAGGLDTTKPAGATVRIRATGSDRIRVNFV